MEAVTPQSWPLAQDGPSIILGQFVTKKQERANTPDLEDLDAIKASLNFSGMPVILMIMNNITKHNYHGFVW